MKKRINLLIGEVRVMTLVLGLFLILLFSALIESYQVLVAGTTSDSIEVSLSVLEIISLSSPSDVELSPDIAGTGTATGNATWNVANNSDSGWKLELNASASPAMTSSGDSIADYTETVAGTPETWSVNSADSEFGFSASGDASDAKYSSGTKFEGFNGATKIQVAGDSGITPAEGEDTAIHFKAEVGSSHTQEVGDYSAIITATASTL